jgi:hypothetical protein
VVSSYLRWIVGGFLVRSASEYIAATRCLGVVDDDDVNLITAEVPMKSQEMCGGDSERLSSVKE